VILWHSFIGIEANSIPKFHKMKNFIIASVFAFAISACNQQPQTKAANVTTDTTGMAAFQAMQRQHLQDSIALANKPAEPAHLVSEKTTSSRTSSHTSGSGSTSARSTTMSSESSNTATKKKGWSKTAKGAVIGGVVGAGAGAVIDKKHRGAGAVIGGVVGAGAGAIIGNEKDKKDGRH
jgi:hypothetical protein